MKSIYLAGPISGLVLDDATWWRYSVADEFAQSGFKVLSPLRHERAQYKEIVGPLTETACMPFAAENPFIALPLRVKKDLFDIRRADLVFVNYLVFPGGQASLGTAAEIGYAAALGKPIVMVTPEERAHPNASTFLDHLATAVVHTLGDGIWVATILLSEGV